MTGLTTRNITSIVVIAFYILITIVCAYLVKLHKPNRVSGWYFLIIFAILRIIAAAVELQTTSSPNNASLYICERVLFYMSLPPLLLVSLRFLRRGLSGISANRDVLYASGQWRISKQLKDKRRRRFLVYVLQLVIEFLFIADAALMARRVKNGGDWANAVPSGVSQAAVGMLIFSMAIIAIFIAIPVLVFMREAPRTEKWLLSAVIATSLPLATRILYTSLDVFTHQKTFDPVAGNIGMLVGMALIMEFIIAIAFVGAALYAKPPMEVERFDFSQYQQRQNQQRQNQQRQKQQAEEKKAEEKKAEEKKAEEKKVEGKQVEGKQEQDQQEQDQQDQKPQDQDEQDEQDQKQQVNDNKGDDNKGDENKGNENKGDENKVKEQQGEKQHVEEQQVEKQQVEEQQGEKQQGGIV